MKWTYWAILFWGNFAVNIFKKLPFFADLFLTPDLDSSHPCRLCQVYFTFQLSKLREKKWRHGLENLLMDYTVRPV